MATKPKAYTSEDRPNVDIRLGQTVVIQNSLGIKFRAVYMRTVLRKMGRGKGWWLECKSAAKTVHVRPANVIQKL